MYISCQMSQKWTKGKRDTLQKNKKKGLIEIFKYFNFSNSGKYN